MTLPALLTKAERADDGKAMSALTNQEWEFVQELMRCGFDGQGLKAATRKAGYSANAGYRIVRKATVAAALREVAAEQIHGGVLASIDVAAQIRDDPTHKDRLKAARWLAELGGFVVQSEQKITVEHQGGNPDEARAELRRLMSQMGPQAKQIAAAAGLTVTEADFETLAPDGEPW